jgi:hypothetical protein
VGRQVDDKATARRPDQHEIGIKTDRNYVKLTRFARAAPLFMEFRVSLLGDQLKHIGPKAVRQRFGMFDVEMKLGEPDRLGERAG